MGARAGNTQSSAPSLPATPAAAAHALPAAATRSAAATRGSARSSAVAAAASFPLFCAQSSGVQPSCSRGEGRGAGRRAPEPPLRPPYHIHCQGVHPRGREEGGDDGGVTFPSRLMQRSPASLQGRGRRRREEGGGKRGGAQGGGDAARGDAGGGRDASAGGLRGALWTSGAPARPPSTGPNPRGLSPIA